GARVLVHREGSQVAVFSRRGNDVTAAVPEIVELVQTLPAQSLVLDGEALALRPNGKPQPFRVTMRRFGRRLGVERLREELPLSVSFFDCLYRDGVELIDRPAQERMVHLDAVVPTQSRIVRQVVADSTARSR